MADSLKYQLFHRAIVDLVLNALRDELITMSRASEITGYDILNMREMFKVFMETDTSPTEATP